jgi:hypothetical protein
LLCSPVITRLSAQRAEAPLLADAAQQDPRQRGIMQGVIGHRAGSSRPDNGVPQRFGHVGADADQDLVPGGLAAL